MFFCFFFVAILIFLFLFIFLFILNYETHEMLSPVFIRQLFYRFNFNNNLVIAGEIRSIFLFPFSV